MRFTLMATISAVAVLAAPAVASACACGCGVFGVGTGSLFPSGSGGSASLEFDRADQDQNWRGDGRADPSLNDDKRVTTDYVIARGQYMFDRRWGVTVEAPLVNRTVVADEGAGLETARRTGLGDVRVSALYTGLSDDMSVGLIAGVKLPTGGTGQAGLERDMQIGSGSTDLLLGGYKMSRLGKEGRWVYFGQAVWDRPVVSREGYAPGRNSTLRPASITTPGASRRGRSGSHQFCSSSPQSAAMMEVRKAILTIAAIASSSPLPEWK